MTDKKRILIVEDAPDIQDLLAILFESEGFEVQRAFNGKEALQRLDSKEPLPHMILLDLMMPVMDGFDFKKNFDQLTHLPHIPVVVMTADSNPNRSSQRSISADAFVNKPVSVNELLAVARRYTSVVPQEPPRHSPNSHP